MTSDYEKYVKPWRKANPEKVAAQSVRYRAKHPETSRKAASKYRAANLEKVRTDDAERQRQRRKSDPEGQKRRNREYAERQEALRVRIAERPRAEECDVCAATGRTVFDHCHAAGHFRGWLCDRCNRVLGSVYDDDALLMALAEYVRRDRGEVDSEKAELIAQLKLRRTEQKLPRE